MIGLVGGGMDDCVVRIEKLANGYEVEICDPKVRESNNKPKSTYENPWVGYAFSTAAEVVKFLEQHLESLEPEGDDDEIYGKAFAEAASEGDD
jgi:hypothetical protein